MIFTWVSSDFWKLIEHRCLCIFYYRTHCHLLQHKPSKTSVVFKNVLVNQSLLVCTGPEDYLEISKWRNETFASLWWHLILSHSFAFVWYLAIKSGLSPLQLMKIRLCTQIKLTGKGQLRLCCCWYVYLSDLKHTNKRTSEKLFYFFGNS